MKIHQLLLIAFFITLMAIPGLAPDTPHDTDSCVQNTGFCYHGVKCPWCFGNYGFCKLNVICCVRQNWRPECEEATTPVDASTPSPTTTSTCP